MSTGDENLKRSAAVLVAKLRRFADLLEAEMADGDPFGQVLTKVVYLGPPDSILDMWLEDLGNGVRP